MQNRIVVGFDGSPTSADAVLWAVAEAEFRGAAVRVVSSYALPPVIDYYGLGATVSSAPQMAEVKKSYLAGLQTVVSRVAHLYPEVGIDYAAIDQSALSMLLAEAEDSSLIVIGSSGASGLRVFLLGSTTASVMHSSPCPVIVVPVNTSGGEPTRLTPYGRIVVAADGSPASEAAVIWAADEADRRSAELLVLHAWDYPYRPMAEPPGGATDMAKVDAALVMDAAVEQAQERCGARVQGVLREGGAAKALIEASSNADMVVMGSRGRGGFRSMLLGSVTQAVAAHAACPVVVLRSPVD